METTGGPCQPYLKALSDETRWRMVQVLIGSADALSLGELASRLDISNYNASRHVTVLEEVGIVETQRKGRLRLISVTRDMKESIEKGEIRKEILNLGCCTFEFPSETNQSSEDGCLDC